MPLWASVMDAYDSGELAGTQPISHIAEIVGGHPKGLGRAISMLGFTKEFDKSGQKIYSPPRRTKKYGYRWPSRYSMHRTLLKRGMDNHAASVLLSEFGVDRIGEATYEVDTPQELSAVCRRLRKEAELELKEANKEVITREELAEALRESPNMPKEGLLNRARGLVKAATRKGNWEDFTHNNKEKDNGTA